MDDATAEVIKRKLRAWGGERIDQAKLIELRDEITSKIRKHKFAPFSNVKKWIKMVRKQLKGKRKGKKPKPKARAEKTAEGEEAIDVSMDKVFLQNISFEIAGIRRSLERLSQQLDAIEKRLPIRKTE